MLISLVRFKTKFWKPEERRKPFVVQRTFTVQPRAPLMEGYKGENIKYSLNNF
jgi:hypothetical protein